MKTEKEIRDHLTEKAQADSAFRAQLIADPKAVVEQEFGVTLPDSISMQVHEETATAAHLVLPPQGDRLTAGEMRAVAGGLGAEGGPEHWAQG